MPNVVKWIIIAVVFFLIVCFLTIVWDAPVGPVVIIALIAAVATYFFWRMKEEGKQDRYAKYDAKAKTLHLKKRGNVVGKSVILKKFGIPVGAAELKEAHYGSRGVRTDKFVMSYVFEDWKIEKIKCEFDIPKDSAVSQYCVDKNTILVMPKGARTNMSQIENQILVNSRASGSKNMESSQIGSSLEQTLLPRKDCETIKSWIYGRIN